VRYLWSVQGRGGRRGEERRGEERRGEESIAQRRLAQHGRESLPDFNGNIGREVVSVSYLDSLSLRVGDMSLRVCEEWVI
jgi:hypothetical protein